MSTGRTTPPPAASTRPTPKPFDVCGPLPTGVTLLEASAGTGKTYTIAALAARYVADGLPLDRLLIVTFTRMATGELRERVRERLVSAAEGLTAALAGVAPDAEDDVACLLATGSPDEVALRHERLAKAIADFDAATIETTHGFCMQVLSGLGTAGDVERDVTLIEDAHDLLAEVVDDLYIRRFWAKPDDLRFDRAEALSIGAEVLRHPTAAILPPLSDDRDSRAIRRRLADAVGKEIDRRKRLTQVLTYDDVLIRLRDTLADPVRGPAACARLQARYEVVLVDEFQDTDPVQWEIMRRAFGSGGSTLVLIGDPKQAIYAFRGADVFAYLDAATQAASEATLAVNWRSDGRLIEAYDALFAGSQLGHEGIAYRTVSAAPANCEPRLIGAPNAAAMRVRILHRDDRLVLTTAKGFASLNPARALIAQDLAGDVVRLLSSGAEVVSRRQDGSEVAREPVRPGHVAVLVRTNRQAWIVRDALHEDAVPAVIAGSGSVFATGPAGEWLRLLEALERPTARDRAASAALTAFVGWEPATVATASDEVWEDLHWSLHRWAGVLRRRGVAALLENITVTRQLPARVLARPTGERFLTDLRHVSQLLHAAAMSDGLGSTALTAWLRRRITEAEQDAGDEDRSRRLESDAEAVQVLTIHRSKGLEFPVVYCPYMWEGYSQEDKVPVFHDPGNGNLRTIDVSREGAGFARHQNLALTERRGEDLRLLYVALTRAKHQAVAWWAGAYEAEHSPLGRLLFARDDKGVVSAFGRRAVTDDEVFECVAGLAGGISVERMAVVEPLRWEGTVPAPPDLEADHFDRVLDRCWRRASYTSITQASHDQTVSSETDEDVMSDEEVLGTVVAAGAGAAGDDGLRAVPLLLAGMPAGTRVGTLIHSVMEATDFAAVDLAGEVRTALAAQLSWQHLDLGDLDVVVEGLCAGLSTPLGPLVGGVRLRDIGRGDRLDEMGFELPLLGGDTPVGELVVGDIAELLAAQLPLGDPMALYAQRLADPSLSATLRGYLTGSLDLVFRLPRERYVIVDYKTNRLGSAGEPLTAWNYRPDAIRAEMGAAHYPLQALLYTVALHRYLRWRVPGYDPERNLCGALYLFLRGMSSPTFPIVDGQPCGVWSWQPPGELVESLSDLFDRGRSAP
ncbi:MAG: UvrD-helicase domain-containing protein [Acidimicrobiales bacterium]